MNSLPYQVTLEIPGKAYTTKAYCASMGDATLIASALVERFQGSKSTVIRLSVSKEVTAEYPTPKPLIP